MKRYHWDQLLDENNLMDLTEEAMISSAARPIPWRRLGALAACLALILCLTNYQALATGVQTLIRYFSGVGAAEQGTQVLVLDAPLTWTDDTWTYHLNAYQAGAYLFVQMEYLSTELEQGADISDGVPDYDLQAELLPPTDWDASWLPQKKALDRCSASYEDLNHWESPEGAALREAGYRTYGSHSNLFQVGAFSSNNYRFRITFTNSSASKGYQTFTYEKELNLVPGKAEATVSDSRTFPEGTITVLVSKDCSGVTNFVDWSPELTGDSSIHALDLQFIGASGKQYPAGFHNTYLEDFAHVEYYPRFPVDEPIAAVEITGVLFEDPSGAWQHNYENLNWIIPLT